MLYFQISEGSLAVPEGSLEGPWRVPAGAWAVPKSPDALFPTFRRVSLYTNLVHFSSIQLFRTLPDTNLVQFSSFNPLWLLGGSLVPGGVPISTRCVIFRVSGVSLGGLLYKPCSFHFNSIVQDTTGAVLSAKIKLPAR